MLFLEWLLDFFSIPVEWFWKNCIEYKRNGEYGKLMLLFLLSLTGLIVVACSFIFLLNYLFENHPVVMAILILIFSLYQYVKDRLDSADDTRKDICPEELIEKAESEYPIMRGIMFRVLKETADDLGGRIPRVPQEIEMSEGHYNISHGICFYTFKLMKEAISVQYTAEEIEVLKQQIQAVLNHKIESGDFPSIQMEHYRDKYGKWNDSIQIVTLSDLGSMLMIETVFSSAEYSDYIHDKEFNQNSLRSNQQQNTVKWGQR